MNFSLPQDSILYVIAAVFAAGLAIPSPVQPIFKTVVELAKQLLLGKRTPNTDQQVEAELAELPALAAKLRKLAGMSSEAKSQVAQELLKTLGLIVLPSNLEDLLSLLVKVNSVRSDVDLSTELSTAWTKVARASAPTNKAEEATAPAAPTAKIATVK